MPAISSLSRMSSTLRTTSAVSGSGAALSIANSPYSIDNLIPRQYEPIPASYSLKKLVVINRHGDRSQIAKELGRNYEITQGVTQKWKNLLPEPNTQEFLSSVAFAADENDKTGQETSAYRDDLYTGWDVPNIPYGQLTNLGALQLMEVGERLRRNYRSHSDVVPTSVAEAATKMFCRSTNFCRTHQSLRGLLSGLLLNEAPVERSSIRPVITTRPRKMETMYPQSDSACISMLRRRGEIFSEDVLHSIFPSYFEVKEKMQKVFQFPDEKINWLHINEVLLCHDVHNITPRIPIGSPSTYPNSNANFTDEDLLLSNAIATMTWSVLYNDDILNRMAIGRFLNDLLNDMSDSEANPLHKKTMLMYSGHDSTIVPILCALKCFDDKWPEYASSIVFEIVEEKRTGEKKVRVVYNDKIMYPWKNPSPWIPLEEFENRLGALRLSQEDYERCCQGEEPFPFCTSAADASKLQEIREDIDRETVATTSGN